ncbi:unnamed protein product, partial [Urochloa humidicola]
LFFLIRALSLARGSWAGPGCRRSQQKRCGRCGRDAAEEHEYTTAESSLDLGRRRSGCRRLYEHDAGKEQAADPRLGATCLELGAALCSLHRRPLLAAHLQGASFPKLRELGICSNAVKDGDIDSLVTRSCRSSTSKGA